MQFARFLWRVNDRRAAWAERAICEFQMATNSDREDALCDLLTDLMHWSDRSGIPFWVSLERAQFHYNAETAPEPE
jgi:hypothetical protein